MREQIQQQAVDLAKTNNVLLLFSVRLGKTKTALDICSNFGNNHLIVTSEVLIQQAIEEEIDKWGFDKSHFTVICYDSLHKYRNDNFDVVVLDESEHITEKNYEHLVTLNPKRWVALCAKMSSDKKQLLRKLFKFSQLRVTYTEAIDMGILSEPKFYILNLYLDNVNRNYIYTRHFKKYAKNAAVTIDFRERYSFFKHPVNLNIRCTAQEYYTLLDENVEYRKNEYFKMRTEVMKNIWLQAGNSRKKWLGSYKTEIAKEIINWMRNREKRFMVFTSTIAQCEELGRGDGVTHSKNSNLDAIKKFNNSEVDELYVVDRGREGITIYGIEEGLIIQASGSDTANYQRAGRLGIAEKPVIYVLQVKGTRDEDYVNKLKEDIDSKFIEEIDYRKFMQNVESKIVEED
jgi:superfamily II DNA or RNA helicase